MVLAQCSQVMHTRFHSIHHSCHQVIDSVIFHKPFCSLLHDSTIATSRLTGQSGEQACLECFEPLQLRQRQVKHFIEEGVSGLAKVVQHVGQVLLLCGEAHGLGLGLLRVVVLLSESQLQRVIQGRRQGCCYLP